MSTRVIASSSPGRGARAALCLLFVLACARAAVAEPVQTIVDNGAPANRVDVVILGDGYTAAEMSKYQADVQQFMQGMFEEEPFREYRRYFNVHRIDVASAESGVDHPERGVFRNTAFDSAYNCAGIQRLICANVGKVATAASNSLAPDARDLIILIVNDSEFGGSGGAIAVASTHRSALNTVLHETGHTLGLLADEYTSNPPTCDNTVEPSQVNVTRETSRAAIKWNAWIDPSTPVPTSTTQPALPGLYLGARYCTVGLYRPTHSSKMRDSTRPYEQVNSEQLVRRIYNRVSPVDSATPAASSLSLTTAQSQTFEVATPSPLTHALAVSWTIDGQPAGTSASLVVAPGALAAGTHTVEATVTDQTAFVRSDPEQLLTERVSWSVTVTSANPIDASAAFVAQHYRDFLGREPDQAGLDFWRNGIESCGHLVACTEVKRVDTSAAFFFAIEFQETGVLVYRTHKAAFGDLPNLPVPLRRADFVADQALIAQNVQVGIGNWPEPLEANKVAYFNAFVARAAFTTAFPTTMTPAQFVDKLNQNAEGALSQAERDQLVNELTSGAKSRAQVLRAVAEDETLKQTQFRRAFVFMQYVGYLRRDPDAPDFRGLPDPNFDGFHFWLGKLNQFNGSYIDAEMVKAFITSIEYRQRFGQ